MKDFLKKVRYIIEAIIVKLGMAFFWLIGPKNASNLGSFLACLIGKMHSTHNLARQNIQNALAINDQKKLDKILDDMWDNLGRVIGEYPHIANASVNQVVAKYVIIDQKTAQNIKELKDLNKGGIIFSAHIGNWEVGMKWFMSQGLDVATVYRPLNNPYVEEMTAKARQTKLIAKGSAGNRQIIETIKNGDYVIIMADQKISEGEPVKFFHDDAITTTSLARIALKYDIPLIPARSIRLDRQFKFKIEVQRPLDFQKTNDINSDVVKLTRLINQKLEEWISEYPSQWFWVHNRWKK